MPVTTGSVTLWPVRRTDRLDKLLKILRDHRLTTAEGLASKLGVSKRTVYRDIRDLARAGIGIRGEAGVGYALGRGVTLPPLLFTTDEALALVDAARFAGSAAEPAIESAVAKIEAGYPGVLPEITLRLGRVQAALSAHLKLAFRGADSERRTIWPLALVFQGEWWVPAWDEADEAYVVVRLDALEQLEVVGSFDPGPVSLEGALRAAASEAANLRQPSS